MKHTLLKIVIVITLLNLICYSSKHKTKINKPVQPVQSAPKSVIPPIKQEIIPKFVQVLIHRQVSDKNAIYADIMMHSKDSPYGDKDGRSTNAHETTHGINSEVRNEYFLKLKKKVNAFYCLDGRAVIVEEPNMKKSQVDKFIPAVLRSYRYNLYIVGQKDWDDTPTYLCDEWSAYVNGGICCVQDAKDGNASEGNFDGVSGCLDFSIYTMALCMAIKEHDPSYWKENLQFRSFVIWEMKRAEATFREGRAIPQFKNEQQETLLKEFLTNPAAEAMRKFVKEELEGIWLQTN